MSRYSFSMGPDAGRQGWFRVGEVEVTTTALVCAGAVISMFVWAASPSLIEPLYFIPVLVREGELWRTLTWPVANEPSIWTAVSVVVLWIVAHRVEDQIGRTRFAALLAVMTVVPALIVTAIPITARTGGGGGIGMFSLAFIVVFAVENPQARFFWGIPIWILAAVFVAIDALQYIGLRAWGLLALEAAVLAVACVGAAAYGVLPRLSWVPQIGGGGSSPRSGKRRTRLRGRRGAKGNVTPGPWAGAPAGPSRLETAELDVLLEKIAESGVKSLTKQEKQRLDELSRKMRGT